MFTFYIAALPSLQNCKICKIAKLASGRSHFSTSARSLSVVAGQIGFHEHQSSGNIKLMRCNPIFSVPSAVSPFRLIPCVRAVFKSLWSTTTPKIGATGGREFVQTEDRHIYARESCLVVSILFALMIMLSSLSPGAAERCNNESRKRRMTVRVSTTLHLFR